MLTRPVGSRAEALLPAALALLLTAAGCASSGRRTAPAPPEPSPPPQEAPREPSPAPAETETAPQAASQAPGGEGSPESTADPHAAAADPCEADYLSKNTWIDRVHRRLLRSTCESALWFDNLFSTDRAVDEEGDVTRGRVALGAAWDEREGTEPITRFRLKYRLPAFERRIDAIVGRGDEDQEITGRGSIGQRVPVFFGDPEDDEWLLGLGYRPAQRGRGGFSAGVGVRVGLPSEPYVKVGYRHFSQLNEESLVRFRQTFFWESRDGTGTTSQVDVEKILGPRRLVRWRNTGTFSESTDGVDWRTSVTLFQKIGVRQGLAYQVGVAGETDAEVTIRNAGFRLIYRRPVFREWLFLDLRPALDWRKETQLEQRKPIWGFGAALEMRFGRWLR